LADFLLFLFDLVGTFSPVRVIVTMAPTLLVAGFLYWMLPNKTMGAYAFGFVLLLGLTLGIWWHIREGKYDRQS